MTVRGSKPKQMLLCSWAAHPVDNWEEGVVVLTAGDGTETTAAATTTTTTATTTTFTQRYLREKTTS